jgi:hypothetical protein
MDSYLMNLLGYKKEPVKFWVGYTVAVGVRAVGNSVRAQVRSLKLVTTRITEVIANADIKVG